MRRIDTGDDQRFALITTPDSRTLFGGIGAILFGAVPIGLGMAGVHVLENFQGAFGYFVVVLGTAMLLFHRGAVVRRNDPTITRWWGLGAIRIYRRDSRLQPAAVQIQRVILRSCETLPETTYPITILGEGGHCRLAHGRSINSTIGVARELAALLGVELIDKTEEPVRQIARLSFRRELRSFTPDGVNSRRRSP